MDEFETISSTPWVEAVQSEPPAENDIDTTFELKHGNPVVEGRAALQTGEPAIAYDRCFETNGAVNAPSSPPGLYRMPLQWQTTNSLPGLRIPVFDRFDS